MPCFYPLRGYRSLLRRGPIVDIAPRTAEFPVRPGFSLIDIPCGRCHGCRLERSRQWAIRCMHEASLHLSNSFVTLTYDDDHLPYGGTLVMDHFQLFMKRLRKSIAPEKVRFFHCGEYGDTTRRPHYHALLFGLDFADKRWYKDTDYGPLFSSASLDALWSHGSCSIGAVTFESAAYVARYAMKKVTGDAAKEHYTVLNPSTGELFELAPEYVTMSRRPGIGREWFDRFGSDVFPDDFILTRGVKCKPPRFYDGLAPKEVIDNIKLLREQRGWSVRRDNTLTRLKVRERVARGRLSTFKRDL